MATSLALARIPTMLLVFSGIAGLALSNAVGLIREDLAGWLGLLDRWGPPLASAMVAPLQSWVPDVPIAADPGELLLRLLLWSAVGVTALWLGFRRLEI